MWFGRSSTTSWRLVKEFHAMTMRLRSVQSTILLIGTSQARPLGFASGLLLLCWWSWVSTPAFSVAGMPVPDVAGLRQGRRMLRQLRHHKQGTTGPRVHHDDTTSRTADMLSFSAWSRRFLNLKQQLYGDRVQDWTSFAIFCFPCPLGWWYYAERQFFRCQPVGIFNSSKAKEAHESFERWLLQVLHHVTSKIHQDSSFGYGSIPINAIFRGMKWTSIYQLFWCSPGVQGFDTLPFLLLHHLKATDIWAVAGWRRVRWSRRSLWPLGQRMRTPMEKSDVSTHWSG